MKDNKRGITKKRSKERIGLCLCFEKLSIKQTQFSHKAQHTQTHTHKHTNTHTQTQYHLQRTIFKYFFTHTCHPTIGYFFNAFLQETNTNITNTNITNTNTTHNTTQHNTHNTHNHGWDTI